MKSKLARSQPMQPDHRKTTLKFAGAFVSKPGDRRRLDASHTLPFVAFVSIVSLALSPTAKGQLSIDHGMIDVGADFGPINGPTGFNVFHASNDLAVNAGGSFPMQGPAEGWAGASWNIGGSSNLVIFAGGSSIHSFNGNTYGWGHSTFKLQVALGQPYAFTAVTPTNNVNGVLGTSGILLAGSNAFAGSTYGNSGGYSVNLRLSPLTAAQQVALTGVNLTPHIDKITVDGGSRDGIQATFSPGGNETLAQAAAALGGDHFNWRQTIVSVPNEWRITINDDIVKNAFQALPSGGIVDPPLFGGGKFIFNPLTGITQGITPATQNPDHTPFFPNGSDYYGDSYVLGLSNTTALRWSDTPSWASDILLPGESVGFVTQLVLEDANDMVVRTIGQPIEWNSDQTSSGIYIHQSTPITQADLEPANGGGIHLGQVPEPGTFSALSIGALLLLVVRRPRAWRMPKGKENSSLENHS